MGKQDFNEVLRGNEELMRRIKADVAQKQVTRKRREQNDRVKMRALESQKRLQSAATRSSQQGSRDAYVRARAPTTSADARFWVGEGHTARSTRLRQLALLQTQSNHTSGKHGSQVRGSTAENT